MALRLADSSRWGRNTPSHLLFPIHLLDRIETRDQKGYQGAIEVVWRIQCYTQAKLPPGELGAHADADASQRLQVGGRVPRQVDIPARGRGRLAPGQAPGRRGGWGWGCGRGRGRGRTGRGRGLERAAQALELQPELLLGIEGALALGRPRDRPAVEGVVAWWGGGGGRGRGAGVGIRWAPRRPVQRVPERTRLELELVAALPLDQAPRLSLLLPADVLVVDCGS